jgi:hypothetical protein
LANKDNPLKGAKFEEQAKQFFAGQGIHLERGLSVDVGVSVQKKPHKFDLGSEKPPVLVECKAHTWTEGGNSPSAKMSVWNEAMYYFVTAPSHFRKILFVLKSTRKGETLADYYIRRFKHLIPEGVELWEFDATTGQAKCVYGNQD